jgi:hypothetical protein
LDWQRVKNLQATGFGFSVKLSNLLSEPYKNLLILIWLLKGFIWHLIMNSFDDNLIEKPRPVAWRFVNFVVCDFGLSI